MSPSLDALRPEYLALWNTLALNGAAAQRAADEAAFAYANIDRYEAVGGGVPWWWIACVHRLESDGDFRTHLANGDPLTARTRHVPAGIPRSGAPPFTWVEGAVAALQHEDSLWGQSDWSLSAALWRAEAFNGWGYRPRGINSPYLWAGSNHYTRGKFTDDGRYDPHAVSDQIGVAAILRGMIAAGAIPAFPEA
jgi:lysozyme family protein